VVATINIDAQMAALEGQVGFREGANNANPYGTWQGVSNAAYCASFTMWGACEHGGYRWPDHCQFAWKGDAYVPWVERHAQELGLWRGRDYRPKRGDPAIYDWTGWGGGDHIAAAFWGSDDGYETLWMVEGNTGSPQGVHWVRRDWTYIRGFVAFSAVGLVPTPVPSGPREIKRGLSGDDVLWLQHRLVDLGYDLPGGIDGDFGVGTEQATLNFQFDWVPYERDGIVGLVTREALADDSHRADMHPAPPPQPPPAPPWGGVYLRRGDSGDAVATFQARLAERGWVDSRGNLLTVDGWFGTQTMRVVYLFQAGHGLEPDGIVGRATWDAFWTEPVG
jgi:peptidoglycan hydrolase-like protein with peptidoglycan-binding domain